MDVDVYDGDGDSHAVDDDAVDNDGDDGGDDEDGDGVANHCSCCVSFVVSSFPLASFWLSFVVALVVAIF